jgi:hypothetical protein
VYKKKKTASDTPGLSKKNHEEDREREKKDRHIRPIKRKREKKKSIASS